MTERLVGKRHAEGYSVSAERVCHCLPADVARLAVLVGEGVAEAPSCGQKGG